MSEHFHTVWREVAAFLRSWNSSRISERSSGRDTEVSAHVWWPTLHTCCVLQQQTTAYRCDPNIELLEVYPEKQSMSVKMHGEIYDLGRGSLIVSTEIILKTTITAEIYRCAVSWDLSILPPKGTTGNWSKEIILKTAIMAKVQSHD